MPSCTFKGLNISKMECINLKVVCLIKNSDMGLSID